MQSISGGGSSRWKAYFTLQSFVKIQAGMAGDFTNKAGLFVEIPSVEIRLVGGKDLIGLGNDPNLLIYTFFDQKRESLCLGSGVSVPRSCHLQLSVAEDIEQVSS